MELILASSSQRRQDLLEEANVLFRVEAPLVDEWTAETNPELSPPDLALANARLKVAEVSQHHPDAAVLAADTVVVCENRILGKPADLAEAGEMLRFLSGKTHEVLTAVTLVRQSLKEAHEHVARTRVRFRHLDAAIISTYLQRVHVLDKAGAYAIQEHGGDIVEQVEGSVSNVIGLPMEIVLPWTQKE